MLRAIPEASVTSSTGASSHFAISAVEPSSPVGVAESKSPIIPSMIAISKSRVGARESREHGVATHHPSVEVMRGHACSAPMVRRVEVVGTAFEGGDLESACSQRRDETDCGGGLADATASGGNHQAWNVERSAHRGGLYYGVRIGCIIVKESGVNAG